MKNKQLFIACIACAVCLASCTQKLQDSYADKDRSLISVHPFTSLVTKAPINGTTFPDRSMVVASYYYATGGGSSETFFSNVTFTKSGTSWTADKYWPLAGELDFLAYSCPALNPSPTYSGTKITDQVSITIGDNSTTQEDILYAYAAQTSRVNSVSMTFKHAQALISFKAKSNLAYNATTNVGITITGITLNGAKYSGTCLMKNDGTCTWSALGNQKDKSVPDFASVNLTTTYSAQLGTGILVPEQACTTATITYTLHNGKQGGENLNNTGLVKTVSLSSPDGSWVEGKHYCYQINVSQYGISISPDVTDWTSGNPDTVNIP